MHATVMYSAGHVRIEDVPDPSIVDPTDAILRVTRACICGSDLWPYASLEPTETGPSMGHEAIGVVDDVDADVRTVRPAMPFAFSDGTCALPRGAPHRLPARRLLRQQRAQWAPSPGSSPVRSGCSTSRLETAPWPRSPAPSPSPPGARHADHPQLPRDDARPERLVHRRRLHRHRRDADGAVAAGGRQRPLHARRPDRVAHASPRPEHLRD